MHDCRHFEFCRPLAGVLQAFRLVDKLSFWSSMHARPLRKCWLRAYSVDFTQLGWWKECCRTELCATVVPAKSVLAELTILPSTAAEPAKKGEENGENGENNDCYKHLQSILYGPLQSIGTPYLSRMFKLSCLEGEHRASASASATTGSPSPHSCESW